MILEISLLVESFTTQVAHERLDTVVNAYVSVERRGPVERLATYATDVRLLCRVDDLMPTERGRLTEAFRTDLYNT